MGIEDNFNKFLEKAPYDDGRANPDYPWIRGSGGILGDRQIIHENPEKPNEAYREIIHHDGTFEHKEASGLSNILVKESRRYVSGGDSNNSDGHSANHSQSSRVVDTKLDHGQSSGGDVYSGNGGKSIGGSKEGGYEHTDGDRICTSKGSIIQSHEGNLHSSFEGDQISTVIGTHYHTVVGEYGINVQDGNFDLKVNSGKLNITSSDILSISSDTKIVLTKGSSSIIMEDGKITFKAQEIAFERG